MNSCYRSTEWEDVTSDYDPVLNVMGIISLDRNIESFVEVYPTVDLTSVSTILIGYDSTYYKGKGEDGGYWGIYEIYKPANIIDSAIVRILSEADTFLFNYDANDGEYKNSDFEPEANSLYNLSVDVNGFDPVIGRLITPSLPQIDSSLNDTLPSSSTYTINWNNNQTSAENGLLTGERIDSYTRCGGEFYSRIEFDSEEFTVFPQLCAPEDVSVGDIDNDYGIRSESDCICDNYRIWDQDSGTCICDDNNPPLLENNDVAVLFGDCDSAVNEYDCAHKFDNETFLYEYCPVTCGGCEYTAGISETVCDEWLSIYCPETCGVCSPNDVIPLEDRHWSGLDLNYVANYLGFEIGALQTDYGYCGEGTPDYETIRIRFMAMDDNYYQYFARERVKEFSNFLFGTSGTSGQSIGIEGGFGVFGAFASDTLTRVLSP